MVKLDVSTVDNGFSINIIDGEVAADGKYDKFLNRVYKHKFVAVDRARKIENEVNGQ